MELGMIGLGKMGLNMTRRLLGAGHSVVAYDPVSEVVQIAGKHGANGVGSLYELVAALAPPRHVWLMAPSGGPTENTLSELSDILSPGDTILDGGNSYYKDSMRRSSQLLEKDIHFLDVGTSGGIWGLKDGYALTVGGEEDIYKQVEPILQALAPAENQGYGRVGPSGAGHFVKMIHNGIEYGLMQAYAEGFDLMDAKKEFKLDLGEVAEIWRYGSVIRSWLLDLTAQALMEDPELDDIQAYVEDTGEGRWTVQESIDLSIPAPVITQALQMRFRSRQDQPFSARMIAALRQQFGGHSVKKR